MRYEIVEVYLCFALQFPIIQSLIEYIQRKLGSVFNEMFEVVQPDATTITEDTAMAELSFFLYLINEGGLINSNSRLNEWNASDVEAHVTSKIVDPVMLRLKDPADFQVTTPYLR